MGEFILYSYYRSSASYRVRIALKLKGIAYGYKAIDLLKDDQYSNEYSKLNPSQQVPTLVHNGKNIAQSIAIVDYLDQIQPNPRLFPVDPYKRALVFQACEVVNSGIQPLHNLKVLIELEKRFGADQTKKDAWRAFWIQVGLESMETFLSQHAGEFSFGDTVTAADCFLIPHLANADRYKISVSPYKTLLRIQGNCQKLTAFRESAPGVQPDSPPAP